MTTVTSNSGRPVAQGSGETSTGAGPRSAEVWHLRSVAALVVLLVLTQRIGISTGGTTTSIAIPLAYGFVGVSLLGRFLVMDRLRAGLLTIAVSGCLLTTAAVSWLALTSQFSLTSLALLIVLYVPWALRAPAPYGAAVVRRAGLTFVWTMLVLSVVGMAQVAGQLVGLWQWQDYMTQFVPSEFLISGYNYNNALAYGLSTYKGTGFVTLEPSFLSQFCGLAILIGIMLRIRAWQLLVLAGGLGSAVSGTGLILLGAGAVLLVLRAPRQIRISYVVTGAVVPVIFLQSPLASFLLTRQDEITTPGTSGNARFVAPYQEAWKGLMADPTRFFVGGGPGSVDRIIPGRRVTVNGGDVLYSVVPKLAFEYGVLAGGFFALFLVFAIIDRAPWRVVPGALVVMVFVLSGALLQPQTAYLAWLLSGIGAASGPGQLRASRDYERERAPDQEHRRPEGAIALPRHQPPGTTTSAKGNWSQ